MREASNQVDSGRFGRRLAATGPFVGFAVLLVVGIP
jgi:hypothetical protein